MGKLLLCASVMTGTAVAGSLVLLAGTAAAGGAALVCCCKRSPTDTLDLNSATTNWCVLQFGCCARAACRLKADRWSRSQRICVRANPPAASGRLQPLFHPMRQLPRRDSDGGEHHHHHGGSGDHLDQLWAWFRPVAGFALRCNVDLSK